MKLAEALLERSECQERLHVLESRLQANLKIQEGDEPHEDPQALLKEAMEVQERLCTLIQRINRTNQTLELEKGVTLSDALARRDMLRRKRQMLSNLAPLGPGAGLPPDPQRGEDAPYPGPGGHSEGD